MRAAGVVGEKLFLKLRLNQGAEGFVEIVVGEAVEDLLKETEGEEFVGLFFGDTAGLEIKLLLGVDARGRGAVRAADVVGLDFEAGERAGFSVVAEHEVAVALVSVGFLRVGIDDDEVRTGNAMILDPYGRILAETSAAADAMVVADLDASLLEYATGRLWIRARRPELYGPLTQRTGQERSTREIKFQQ